MRIVVVQKGYQHPSEFMQLGTGTVALPFVVRITKTQLKNCSRSSFIDLELIPWFFGPASIFLTQPCRVFGAFQFDVWLKFGVLHTYPLAFGLLSKFREVWGEIWWRPNCHIQFILGLLQKLIRLPSAFQRVNRPASRVPLKRSNLTSSVLFGYFYSTLSIAGLIFLRTPHRGVQLSLSYRTRSLLACY